MKALEREVDCAECGEEAPLDRWLEDPLCSECGQEHVVPRLATAVEAAREGEAEGATLEEVVEGFRLHSGDAVDLLMALGCGAEAAVDVERTVVEGRVPSEWRRLVGRTRAGLEESYDEAEEVLAGYGVSLEPPTG